MENVTVYEFIPIFLALILIFLSFLQMRIWKRRMEKDAEEFSEKLVKIAGEQDKLSSMTNNEHTEEKE